MSHQILVHPKVDKELARLGAKESARIRTVLLRLADNPRESRPGADIKKLKGTHGRQDLYRIRIGEFRAIYAVTDDEVLVTDLFRRGQGYDL